MIYAKVCNVISNPIYRGEKSSEATNNVAKRKNYGSKLPRFLAEFTLNVTNVLEMTI